jgi:prophage regulatory protein
MVTSILGLPLVKTRTGLSRSIIYQSVGEGKLPRAVNLGARDVGWLETEIDGWPTAQIDRSRKSA